MTVAEVVIAVLTTDRRSLVVITAPVTAAGSTSTVWCRHAAGTEQTAVRHARVSVRIYDQCQFFIILRQDWSIAQLYAHTDADKFCSTPAAVEPNSW